MNKIAICNGCRGTKPIVFSMTAEVNGRKVEVKLCLECLVNKAQKKN